MSFQTIVSSSNMALSALICPFMVGLFQVEDPDLDRAAEARKRIRECRSVVVQCEEEGSFSLTTSHSRIRPRLSADQRAARLAELLHGREVDSSLESVRNWVIDASGPAREFRRFIWTPYGDQGHVQMEYSDEVERLTRIHWLDYERRGVLLAQLENHGGNELPHVGSAIEVAALDSSEVVSLLKEQQDEVVGLLAFLHHAARDDERVIWLGNHGLEVHYELAPLSSGMQRLPAWLEVPPGFALVGGSVEGRLSWMEAENGELEYSIAVSLHDLHGGKCVEQVVLGIGAGLPYRSWIAESFMLGERFGTQAELRTFRREPNSMTNRVVGALRFLEGATVFDFRVEDERGVYAFRERMIDLNSLAELLEGMR